MTKTTPCPHPELYDRGDCCGAGADQCFDKTTNQADELPGGIKLEAETTNTEIDPTSFRKDTSQLNQQSSQANGRADAPGGVFNSHTTTNRGEVP